MAMNPKQIRDTIIALKESVTDPELRERANEAITALGKTVRMTITKGECKKLSDLFEDTKARFVTATCNCNCVKRTRWGQVADMIHDQSCPVYANHKKHIKKLHAASRKYRNKFKKTEKKT